MRRIFTHSYLIFSKMAVTPWLAALLVLPGCFLEDEPKPNNGLSLAASLPNSTLVAGTCGKLDFTSRSGDTVIAANENTGINVTGLGTGTLYSDAACTQVVTNVVLEAGQSLVTVYFVPTTAGSISIELDDGEGGYTPAKLAVSVVASESTGLRIVGPATAVRGTCSDVYRVEASDAYGNQASTDTALTVQLSGAGNGAFYSDSSCTTVITERTIPAGLGSGEFYIKDSTAEFLLLGATLTPETLSPASRPVLVYNSPATRLGILATDERVAKSSCSQAFTLRVVDSGGSRVALNPGRDFELRASAAGVFYSNSTCTLPITKLNIAANSDSKDFFFKSETLGAVSISGLDPTRRLTTAKLNLNVLESIPGALDPSFGTSGLTVVTFGSGETALSAMALGADGKMVAVGHFVGDNGAEFAVTRVNADGTLDPTFNTTGKVTTDVVSGKDDKAYGVALQSDGKILVVGTAGDGADTAATLVRYNANGSLDTTFSSDGIVVLNPTTEVDMGRGVAIQADGKAVIVGSTNDNTDFLVARFNTDGTPDVSFALNGSLALDIRSDDSGFAIAVQSDGKLVVAGQAWSDDFGVARLLPDGSFDTTFLDEGKQAINLGNLESATAVSVTSAGVIHVSGWVKRSTSADSDNHDIAALRIRADGTLDGDFNSDGKSVLSRTNRSGDDISEELSYAHLVQTDGKLLVAGQASLDGVTVGDLARFDTGGLPDAPLFGKAGATAPKLGGTSSVIRGIVPLSGNRCVVGATRDSQSFVIAAIRL